MADLYLDQTSYLAINHPIELGYENDLIAVVSVLTQELYPVLTALGVPAAGVENKLGLVHYKQYLIFSDLATFPINSCVLREPFGRKKIVGPIGEKLPVVARTVVYIEVGYNGHLPKPQSVAYIAGGVKTLAAARGARI